MGAAGPLSLTDRETEAQAAARAVRPGGAAAGSAGQGAEARGGGAPGPRSPRRRPAGGGLGGDPQASPGARPPLGGAHGARAAAAAAAAAGGAGVSAQPRPRPLPASPPLDNRSGEGLSHPLGWCHRDRQAQRSQTVTGNQAPAPPRNWSFPLWLPWSLGSPHLRETNVFNSISLC